MKIQLKRVQDKDGVYMSAYYTDIVEDTPKNERSKLHWFHDCPANIVIVTCNPSEKLIRELKKDKEVIFLKDK